MATKQKEKSLKLTEAKRLAKKVEKLESYELHDGSIYKFHPYFSETLIEQMMLDLQLLLNEANTNDIELSDSIIYHLINLVIIKHASPPLKKQFKNGIVEHLNILDNLRNAGYYSEIINDVLLKDQMQKVRDKIAEIMAESKIIEDMFKQVAVKMQELKIKNADVFGQLDKLNQNQKQLQ